MAAQGWQKKFQLLIPVAVVAFCVAVSVTWQPWSMPSYTPEIRNGFVDLSGIDIADAGLVRLKGDWHFYPGVLAKPDELAGLQPEVLRVPGFWRWEREPDDPLADGFGAGTYALKIRTDRPYPRLTLKLIGMMSASDVYINGVPADTPGKPGLTRDQSEPSYRYHDVLFESPGTEISIVLHLSNFHYRQGGIRKPVVLGTPDKVGTMDARRFLLDAMMYGCLMIMFLYHIGYFYLNREDKASLYFALFSLNTALVMSCFSFGQIIFYVFPGIGWDVQMRLLYTTLFFAFPLFWEYCINIFPGGRGPMDKAIRASAFVFLPLMLFDSEIYTWLGLAILVPLALGPIMCVWLIYRMVRHKVSDLTTRILAVSILIYMFTSLNDVLVNFEIYNGPTFFHVGLLVFTLGNSFLLSWNVSRTFRNMKQAESRYKRLNQELSESVRVKSSDLEEKSKALLATQKEVEKQMMLLQTSSQFMQSLNHDKNWLLGKLTELGTEHLPRLVENLEGFRVRDHSDQLLVGDALKEAREIQNIVTPMAMIYNTERNLDQRRVLIADEDQKYLSVVRLALGGAGVKLAVVQSEDDLRRQVERHQFDIILTSARFLPTCNQARAKSPGTSIVLSTQDNMSVWLEDLQRYPHLSNIIQRRDHDPAYMSNNIVTTVRKILDGDIFGLEKYLNWGVDVSEFRIESSVSRVNILDRMERALHEKGLRRSVLKNAVAIAEELMMNALWDAPIDSEGNEKYSSLPRNVPLHLPAEEQGTLRYALDGNLLAISVEDPFGSLTRDTILTYLKNCFEDKNFSFNETTGKTGAGLGLYRIVTAADLVIINVNSGNKTELITFLYVRKDARRKEISGSFHFFAA